MAGEGSVYRRCGCADTVPGRQFGGQCPRLAGSRHGSWYVRLELPAGLDGRRRRIRRGGYPSRKGVMAVLGRLRSRAQAMGTGVADGEGLASALAGFPHLPGRVYRPRVHRAHLYLTPYLGQVLLAELSAGQVQAMFTAIIPDGTGPADPDVQEAGRPSRAAARPVA